MPARSERHARGMAAIVVRGLARANGSVRAVDGVTVTEESTVYELVRLQRPACTRDSHYRWSG